MNVVIIEDERFTAADLADTIQQAEPGFKVVATVRSVEDGRRYFAAHAVPDLIFSDIQLGDGLSFELLKNVTAPVIFCTAYDEYALQAFRTNGIDYILKPFTLASVAAAIAKYRLLAASAHSLVNTQQQFMQQMLDAPGGYKQVASLLVHERDSILPIKLDDIAFFRMEHEIVRLHTFSKAKYFPNKSLEELEKLVGRDFYRANRQYLISRNVVVKVSNMLTRKLSVQLSVPLDENLTISKEKATDFLRWLSGGDQIC